ncbi:DUF4245 domain-containing protein [Knoellia subterranea]|uniref:DUF4245 domain-containing protein n=1 Tax=Knoellia subterranea KCTC 19937 TaxID=1385521 RepID=A0A0A0JSF4_9MICO|nr:DUF4245 domain-containing protein [Knoellia subterranea]KGN39634.1 hypothetical protein N803_03195 [Knoellia subterranea KCTC 19937]
MSTTPTSATDEPSDASQSTASQGTAPTTSQATPRKSSYSMGSTPNMVRSLIVIGALMALIWFMTPRVNTLGGPVVDVHGTAVQVAEDSGWPISEAIDLPEGWRTTSARYVRSTDKLMTWHAGYQSPAGTYVAVEQTRDATRGWVEAQTNRARRIGEVTIGDVTWIKYERGGKVQNSMLDRRTGSGEMTTLLTGTGSFEEMALVAEHLGPVKP